MNWKAEIKTHRQQKRIVLYFEYDATAIQRLKKLEDVKWSQTLNAWHLPDTAENRVRFKLTPENCNIQIDDTFIQVQEFGKYLSIKRYSPNTIKTYTEALKTFLRFYPNKSATDINNDDVINYHQNYILKNELSTSYQNQIII